MMGLNAPVRSEFGGFLRQANLFAGLSHDELASVVSAMSVQAYPAGAVIVEEGIKSDRLFLLHDGEVEIVVRSQADTAHFSITTLARGEVFGDISFLDGRAASATVRARGPCGILSLSRSQLESALSASAFAAVMTLMAVMIADRIRRTNEALVQKMQAERDLIQMRNHFGTFFIVMTLITGLQNFLRAMAVSADINVRSEFYSWGSLLILLIPFISGQ
jgi:CRP-like cAMP-binding protein